MINSVNRLRANNGYVVQKVSDIEQLQSIFAHINMAHLFDQT
jgi:hypothetical protein